jgi:two-component system, OmpR family, KDP operon response regulator KdpE
MGEPRPTTPPPQATIEPEEAAVSPERRPIALIIEAPNPGGKGTRAALERCGFTTWHAATGTDARRLLLASRHVKLEPDVIVVDRQLPDVDGLVLCAFLRKIAEAPIVLCASVRRSADRTLAYSVGVEGFVATPTITEELQALISGILRSGRRTEADEPIPLDASRRLTVGNLEILEEQRAASVGSHRLQLTPTQYRLLVALAKGAPNVVPRAQLEQFVWSTRRESSSSPVANQIARLRARLSEVPVRTPAILSIPGVGYRLGPAV